MEKNTWYKVGNQSLAVYARNAGFDLAIYDEYSDAVKTELRKRTVTEAMRSIEWACQEHGFDLPGLKGGVYVISLANPLSLLYPGGTSFIHWAWQRACTHQVTFRAQAIRLYAECVWCRLRFSFCKTRKGWDCGLLPSGRA
jgi:hypothetical protein